jgi:hypothetical protein
MYGTFSGERVREFDEALAHGRAAVRTSYERTVRHNLTHELESLERALELDLIDANDFRQAA